LNIRQATEEDASRISEIYNYYVLNTTVTFENAVVDAADVVERIREKMAKYNWLVGEVDGRIVGYSYFGSFRPRSAYRETVESTIILDRDCTGRGYGSALYEKLLQSVETMGFREIIAVIALPNPESLKLHRKMGFVEAGVLRNVGFKQGRYIDIAFWQKSLH
jgi:L-amino acid N-acyltransferase YncA